MNDYKKFLDILEETGARYTLKIYSYVLLPNHYHLGIKTLRANLTKAMHYIQSRYTNYFNRRYNRVGHLFQGRYKALLVDKDNYLIELVRYIHLNPVRAEIVRLPEQYRWSSYREYIDKPRIIDTETVMEYFGNDQEKFRKFTVEGIDKKWEDIVDGIYGQMVIGTKQFTDKVKQMLSKTDIGKEISFGDKIKKRVSKEKIINMIVKHFKITKNELFTKKGRWNEPKKIGIYLIRKYTGVPLNLIGKIFGGTHYTGVSHISKKMELRRVKDKDLNRVLEKIESKIKT